MKRQELESLKIEPGSKEREQKPALLIFVVVALITGVILYFAWPRESDLRRVVNTSTKKDSITSSAPGTIGESPKKHRQPPLLPHRQPLQPEPTDPS